MQTIPGPSALANLRLLHDPYAAHDRARARYGPLFRSGLPGAPSVVIARADGVREVLALPPSSVDVWMRSAMTPLFGERSIFTAPPADHRRHRRAILSLPAPAGLGREVRARIEALPDRIDLGEASLSIAQHLIQSVLFGPRGDVLSGPLSAFSRSAASKALAPALVLPALRSDLYPPWASLRQTRRALIEAMEPLSGGPGPGHLARSLSAEELSDDLLTLLIAGHETTARAIAWALVLLLSHPSALRDLRDEIDQLRVDPDDDRAVCALPLLRATALEALRCRTIVLQINRALIEPCELLGHDIPAGVTLSLGAHLVHHDPEHFSAPERFSPPRFLSKPPDPLVFLAFGAGHRRCTGADLALDEICLVLFHLLSAREIAPLYQGPVRGHLRGLVLAPGPLPVALSRRLHARCTP